MASLLGLVQSASQDLLKLIVSPNGPHQILERCTQVLALQPREHPLAISAQSAAGMLLSGGWNSEHRDPATVAFLAGMLSMTMLLSPGNQNVVSSTQAAIPLYDSLLKSYNFLFFLVHSTALIIHFQGKCRFCSPLYCLSPLMVDYVVVPHLLYRAYYTLVL
jgi:hypothetical protein